MAPDLFDAWLNAWNENDGSALAVFMTDDGIYEDVPWGRVLNPSTIGEQIALGHRNSSDLSVKYISTVHAVDRYATEWEMRGTNDGPIARNMPASGQAWTIRGASVGASQAGKIKVHRDYWDLSGWLAQLGHPSPPQVDWVRAEWSEEH
jgi:steroid delta-isomerase-like uncharacterized protein